MATAAGVLTPVMVSMTPVSAAGAGTISTFAGGNAVGDGNAATAGALNSPLGVAVDPAGNLYIADKANRRVRRVVPGADGIIGKTNASGQNIDADDIITTVAGNGTAGSTGDGQPATSAELFYPQAVAVDASGNLYVVDEGANRVRFVCLQATSCNLPANAGGPSVASGAITTVAGNGSNSEGGNGGAAKAAGLSGPVAIAFDGTGNLFITDSYFNTVRFVCLQASTCINAAWYGTVPSGDIAAAAATPSYGGDSGDGGPATSALLNNPIGITVDASGNLYIAETSGNTPTHGDPIRKVAASTGIITTLSTGPSKTFEGAGLQFSSSGGTAGLYISNVGDNDVLSLNLSTLAYTTVAGMVGACGFAGDGGPATSASLCQPGGIDVTPAGELFIPDAHFLRVRKVNTTGLIVTVAGDGQTVATGDGGPATSGGLSTPWDLATDGLGDVFVADGGDNRVRFVCVKSSGCALPTGTVAQGNIATVAGNGATAGGPGGDGGDGGLATSAATNFPQGVALDRSGNLYVADYLGGRVRFVCMQTSACTLPAGSGGPSVSPGAITTIAGTGIIGNGGDGGPAAQATIADPIGLAVDGAGNVYVADPANQDVRFVCVQATACTLPAGAGGQVPSGDIITVAGTPKTGGFSGDGGAAAGARLLGPDGVALDSAGNLYVADSANNRIRFICLQPTLCGTAAGFVATGLITTIAGTGASGFGGDGGLATSAMMSGPDGVGLDSAGNLYVADAGNNRLRFICMQATCPEYLSSGGIVQGVITTLAGNGTAGGTGDGGLANAAELNVPRGLALDRANNLYVADENNDRVREVAAPVTLEPYPTPLFPSFANTALGSTSAPLTVTLNNPTAGAVTVTALGLSGTNAADFSIVAGSDHCTGASLAASGGTCTVQVSFAPGARDNRQATLSFTDSAGNSPQTAGLVGIGVPRPTLSGVSPSSGSGASATTVTVTGTGLTYVTSASFGAVKTNAVTHDATNPDTTLYVASPGTTNAAGGTVDVTVASVGGTSATSIADHYTFGAWGFLRVTTPAGGLPAQISMDGNYLDTYGTTWVHTDTGSHQVCFSDYQGWNTPGCQTVSVTQGATTTINGAFTQRGFLQVQESPAGVDGTVSIDGNPMDDYGVFTDLPTGSHQVCWSAAVNFTPPGCQNVTVTAGTTTLVTGTYTSNPGAPGQSGTGLLRATTNPPLASQISVDGIPRDTWGLSWLQLAAGTQTHTVCFRSYQGYTAPACSSVTITAGQTMTVQGNFTQRGFLQATISPAGLDGVISVDGIARDDYGMFTDVPTGSHAVCWGAVNGKTAPACQTVTVNSGVTTNVRGTYQ